mgnify:CR=1 FL=1|jgi:hypothetical protein
MCDIGFKHIIINTNVTSPVSAQILLYTNVTYVLFLGDTFVTKSKFTFVVVN